jgi:hypothetical protein
MANALSILILIFVCLTSAYTIRSLRIIGSKISEVAGDIRSVEKKLVSAEKKLHQDSQQILAKLNLSALSLPGMSERNFDYILSLTSHPARFEALALALPELRNQILQPLEIVVNIAHHDMAALPQSVKDLAATGEIILNECSDLGPGKKLIPTLAQYPNLPIIVVDDDLVLSPDLTLQLMLEHHLYPGAIIASRTHRVSYSPDGSLEPFSAWEKASDSLLGPSFDLIPTSGAGTLFPAGSLHPDALNEVRYSELAFHTDDLWWYFQARRISTKVRRLPGYRPLEFIPETQEVGLWQTGNKDRNDINLKKLIDDIGVSNGDK